MTPAEFAESIENFDRLNFTEQIKRFCWYVSQHLEKSTFGTSDISRCFDNSNCPKPSSINPFLSSLARQRPAFLLRKRNSSFELTKHARTLLDPVLGLREATIAVDKLLQSLPGRVTISSERVYLEEALKCFRHQAFRAAIVMTWNVAYDHFCNCILLAHLPDFNTQLPKSFPKADIVCIASRDDFEVLKESQVLQVAKSANIISGSIHKIMKEKLDRRNIAAHPSGVVVSAHTAEEYIVDLVENVLLKL